MTEISVVIPAHNEQDCIAETVINLNNCLKKKKISHEIVVVNDYSSDDTEQVIKKLKLPVS